MKKENNRTWDEFIEEIISRYEKQWGMDIKEKWQKFLHLTLKRKYEIKDTGAPLTKEEAEFFRKK